MKTGQLYDLNSFKAFNDAANVTFKDAYAGVNLQRNLTHINAEIFTKAYPELTFMNSGVKANNTGGYSPKIQTLRLLGQGGFAEGGDKSENAGIISLGMEDTWMNVTRRHAKTSWSTDELEESKLTNINLPQQYMINVNRAYMREIDEAGLVGLGAQKGLLNHAGIVTGAASGLASAITAQALYDEFSALLTDQWDAVNNTPEYMADTVTMPTHVLNILSSKMLNTAGSAMTVMTALRGNFPGVKFNASFRANSVDGGGSVTAAYATGEDCMVMRLPITLRVGKLIQTDSFNFQTSYMYRIAGFDLLEATSARLLTGL